MEGRGWPERGEPATCFSEGQGLIFINTVEVAFKAHPENGWAFFVVIIQSLSKTNHNIINNKYKSS